jgi:UDP-N-acetylglucosamine--N-acetylmuramyl-(pentapeptide) pyrophosphoryl-undecaprenol N-acetylglucosamine transferase
VRKGVEKVAHTGRRYLFTGGGTGGHVTPNLALIGEIRSRDRSAALLYLGSKGGYEERKLGDAGVPLITIPCAQSASPRRPIKFVKMLLTLLVGTVKALWHVARFKPDVVIATGGYVSVPPVLAAALLKRRIFVHEQNAKPGAANRLLARFATRVGVTFARTLDDFPPPKGVHLGYPVRRRMGEGSADDARRRYGIPEGRKVVFVLGGSMGARALNRGIAEALPTLLKDENVAVIHSTGLMKSPEYHAYDDTVERLRQLGLAPQLPGRYVCREFFDDIQDVYALADLVIARSGAGVVMELGAVGKPGVLIPKSDAPGGHQFENAAVFEEAGAAEIFIEEPSYESGHPVVRVYGDALARRIRALLGDEDLLLRMGRAAHRLVPNDAAERVVSEIESLAEGAPLVARRMVRTRAGALLDDAGRTQELMFSSSVLSSAALSDVRLSKPGRDRAVLHRRQAGDAVEFFLAPRAGRVVVNGEVVEKRRKLQSEDVLEIGANRFTFRAIEREVSLEEGPTRIGRKAFATFFGTALSRVFGFVREALTLRALGAGAAADVMTIGLRIGNFFRAVFAETAVDSLFMPSFVELSRSDRRDAANRLFSTVLKLALLGTIFTTVVACATAPWWIGRIYTPTGPESARLVDEALRVTRIMFPYLILVSVASVLSAVLRSFNRFALPANSSILYTVGVVIGVALYPRLGVEALGYGVLLGGVGQVLVQLPPFFSREFREARGLRLPRGIDLKNPGVRRVGRGAPNIVADSVIAQVGYLIDVRLVSGLGLGAVSTLYFGRILFQLPFALVSQTINTVVLKEFSEGLATKDKDWTKRILVAGVNWNVFFLLPISVFSVLLARPLVDALFVGGSFTPEHARQLATALQCYSLGLVGWGLVALTGRFFAARGETGTATLINFGSLCVNVAASLILVRTKFGFAGVALATTFSFSLAAVVRLVALNRRLREEDAALSAADVWPSFARTLLATGAGAVAASLTLAAVNGCGAFAAIHPKADALFGLLAPAFFGFAAFCGAAFLLQSEELEQILARLGRSRDREEPAAVAKPRPVVPQWLAPASLLAWVERNPTKAAKTDLEKRVAMLLEQPRWQDRNIGVKLVGLLKLRAFRGRLCSMALDRRPAKLSHRLAGGDFQEPGFVRRNALAALGKLSDPDEMIEDALLKALDDPYFEARAAAASAASVLAHAFTPDGRRRLAARTARMTEETNFETATAAAQALGRLATDDGVVDVLRRLHDHPNWKLRDAAVEAYLDLYKRGVLTDRERLSELLDDVLATCDDFRPRFPLKERLLEARKMCRPAARDAVGAAGAA